MDAPTTQTAGKISQLYVFSELLKRGAIPYVPLVDEGLDAGVRTREGQTVELQIKSAGGAAGKHPLWFQVAAVHPRKNFFIVCVQVVNGEPVNAWVFPSAIFDKYAGRPSRGVPRDLDLGAGARKHGIPLKDLLAGFRDRWELIANYEQYEALLESPEELEDILTMKEALEAPEEETFTLEQYERRRSASL